MDELCVDCRIQSCRILTMSAHSHLWLGNSIHTMDNDKYLDVNSALQDIRQDAIVKVYRPPTQFQGNDFWIIITNIKNFETQSRFKD